MILMDVHFLMTLNSTLYRANIRQLRVRKLWTRARVVMAKVNPRTMDKQASNHTLADEEWLKQYKLQSEKERQLESLKNRLSGNETLSNWCLSKDQASALRLWIRLF